MPKLLTEEQMDYHIEVYLELKSQVSKDPSFIKPIITDDGIWIYGYNLKT